MEDQKNINQSNEEHPATPDAYKGSELDTIDVSKIYDLFCPGGPFAKKILEYVNDLLAEAKRPESDDVKCRKLCFGLSQQKVASLVFVNASGGVESLKAKRTHDLLLDLLSRRACGDSLTGLELFYAHFSGHPRTLYKRVSEIVRFHKEHFPSVKPVYVSDSGFQRDISDEARLLIPKDTWLSVGGVFQEVEGILLKASRGRDNVGVLFEALRLVPTLPLLWLRIAAAIRNHALSKGDLNNADINSQIFVGYAWFLERYQEVVFNLKKFKSELEDRLIPEVSRMEKILGAIELVAGHAGIPPDKLEHIFNRFALKIWRAETDEERHAEWSRIREKVTSDERLFMLLCAIREDLPPQTWHGDLPELAILTAFAEIGSRRSSRLPALHRSNTPRKTALLVARFYRERSRHIRCMGAVPLDSNGDVISKRKKPAKGDEDERVEFDES